MTLPRDMSRPCAVYRCFDRDGVLLYVGRSVAPADRVRAHRRHAAWGGSIAEWTAEWLGDVFAAVRAEVAAIERERPLHNYQIAATRLIHYSHAPI